MTYPIDSLNTDLLASTENIALDLDSDPSELDPMVFQRILETFSYNDVDHQ